MHTINPPDFVDKMNKGESMVILDVRTSVEWNAEHLKGTIVHIPLHLLDADAAARLKKTAGTNPIYILCRSGGRAVQAYQFLAAHGVTNLHVINGGIEGCKTCNAETQCRNIISLERQVRIAAGLLVLLGVALGTWLNPWFYALAGFVGAGLIFSGITNRCGVALVLSHAPWNRDPMESARKSMHCFSQSAH